MGSRRRKIRPRCRRADPPLHAPHSPLTGWENKSSRDDLDHHRAAIGPRDRPIIGGGSSEFPLSRSHRHGIAHGALSTIETGDRTAIASQSWKPDPARLASSSRSFFLSRFPSVRSSSCLVIVLSFFLFSSKEKRHFQLRLARGACTWIRAGSRTRRIAPPAYRHHPLERRNPGLFAKRRDPYRPMPRDRRFEHRSSVSIFG